MNGSQLPILSPADKGSIALGLIENDFELQGITFKKPNDVRRHLISKARDLEIDPNRLLAFYKALLDPKLEQVFAPITKADIEAYNLEREQKRLARDAQQKKN